MAWTYSEIEIEEASWGAFYFICTLDGKNFRFDFQYNSREGYWYFDVYDSVGDPVRQGLKCVINWPLIARDMELSAPIGELLFVDTRINPPDPDFETLGINSILTYCLYEADV